MTAAINPCSVQVEYGRSGGPGGTEAGDFSSWLEQPVAATGQSAVQLVSGGQQNLGNTGGSATTGSIASDALAASHVYLEHVFANGYLSNVAPSIVSQLGVGPQGRNRDHMLPRSSTPAIGVGAAEGRAMAAGEAARASQVGRAMQAAAVSLSDAEQVESPERYPSSATAAVADSGLPTAVWAERLLRATREPGERVTLWIRDFRLPEGDLSTLTQALRSLARLQGWNLGRVVINGLERWSAVPGSQEQPSEQSWEEVSCP